MASPKAQGPRTGNASKRLKDTTSGPWSRWKVKTRHGRAIRFMETYLRPPKGYGWGKPMVLAPFQKEWLEEILADGVTAAALECARGQGKSTLLAGLGAWGVFDDVLTGAPQVPVMATRVQQAIRSVYGVMVDMISTEPELATRALVFTGIGSSRLEVPSTGGQAFPMANHPDGLQGLDPSLAIVDEIGFQPLDSWNSLLLASGKRAQSLVVGIGTPGFDRDNALWHLRDLAHVGGTPKGFRFRSYSAPDGCELRDETAWRAANPALDAGFQSIEALRTAVDLTPEAHFRTFHLAQWVDGTDAWLGANGRRTWDALADRDQPFQLGAPTWVGVDIGIKHDTSALVFGQRRADGRLHYCCRLWLPTEDQAVDVTAIMQYLRELDRRCSLVEVAYDPRFFEVPANMLGDEGLPMTEMHQSLERMTPAFGTLFEAIQRGEITHDGTPGFATQVLNAVPRFNERGFTLMKAKSRGKIDAAYALGMCHDRAQHPVKARRSLIAL